MVGEDDFSNSEEELNNLVVASTLDISVIEASHDLTIMDINDLPFGIIQELTTIAMIFIVGGWCYYTEGGRTTTASDESGRQMRVYIALK